ncbi:glycosyltransferase [bacterium]|nr:glycosyltransferase [bacterium]
MTVAREPLLWIVPRNPWPVRCGASYANSALIRSLSQRGWKIHLIAIGSKSTAQQLLQTCEALGLESIDEIPLPSWISNRFVKWIVMGVLHLRRRNIPMTALPFTIKAMQQPLLKKISDTNIRMIVWDGLHPMASLSELTAQHSIELEGAKQRHLHIYRAHNIESMIWWRMAKSGKTVGSLLLRDQAHIMRSFELECLTKAAGVACLIDEDAAWVQRHRRSETHLSVVPVAVETHAPVPKGNSSDEEHLSLLWVGGLNWWPNKQGLVWFLNVLWPQIKQRRSKISLTLVGLKTEKLARSADPQLRALGFIENVAEHYQTADALIVPILAGGGVRIKALEALAYGLPCIGTPLGLCGIPQAGSFVCQSRSEWLETIASLTKKDCILAGMQGQIQLKNLHSAEASSQRMEELIGQVQEDQVGFLNIAI